MRLLLDSHAFLWYVLNDSQLSTDAQQAINDPNNDVLISAATYWEVAIKISVGKYKLTRSFIDFFTDHIARNGFHILPITLQHADNVTQLPLHHRDPFDRLLSAQSLVESIALVSNETQFDQYGVNRVW